MWDALELPAREGRRLLLRQAAWTTVQTAAMGGLALGATEPELALSVATALGVAAARPTRMHLLPLVVAFVITVTMLLAWAGVPTVLALGVAAGFAVGTGGWLARLEAVLAGVAGGGLGLWVANATMPSQGAVGIALWTGCIVGIFVAQALLPGTLRYSSGDRIPSPGRIQTSLQAEYRVPCMRAWQLDSELSAQAPDRQTRRGLGEVAAWVYRLALTLQTLDGDLARIDPVSIRARIAALDGDEGDSFIRERRAGTAAHLGRMLEHRDALARERARAASLQEYALAYLEEARAGLAVARVLPGERPPESLGVVLEKLRAHAVESGARRETAREVEGIR